jgi:N-acetylglutamate synthase-like GNAT family acetyltransferase
MKTLPIDVRRLESDDVDEALHVLTLTYGAAAIRGSRGMMQARQQAWLIARRNGAAAGVVTSNGYGRVAYVAMLAVDPAHRGYGVATLLMEALLAQLEANGAATVLLDATAEAESLYRRLGFAEIDRTRVFARSAPPPRLEAAGPAGGPSPLERALELDALIYGCDRSAALRVFASSPYALVATDEDGYALTRGPTLGPVAAERTSTAERLIRTALARRPHIDRAFPPLANPDAAALLEAHGFSCARTLAHMARGAPSPFRRERIFSQASLGHG